MHWKLLPSRLKLADEGKLFGSIGTRDIADAVTAAGVEVAKSEVRLPVSYTHLTLPTIA